ncbi:MAG: hypothetical protein IK103_05425 [Bacteroidales bacterium]|nr:hypothetical protein [Bacteroidales bacterium]
MKRLFIILAVTAALQACSSAPQDALFDKSVVEFIGNAFSDFTLNDDVNVFLAQNPEDQSKWSIQATVPVKKVSEEAIDSLEIEIVPVDEKGVKVREDLSLMAQDMANIIPVLNSGDSTAKTVVFKSAREFTRKEAEAILAKAENLTMAFNKLQSQKPAVAEETEAKKQEASQAENKEKPTLNSLCEQYGIYGMLAQYENHLKNRDKKAAKRVEDRMWEIEKKVKADQSLPESLRKRFVEYIETREDQIEDKY